MNKAVPNVSNFVNPAQAKCYGTVLIDWDGCLANTLDVWMDGYLATFEQYGMHVTRQEVGRHFGDWDLPLRIGMSAELVDSFNNDLVARVDSGLELINLHAGARDFVDAARNADKKIALITSSLRDHLHSALERLGLVECFDLVLCGDDVAARKPDPAPLNAALKHLGSSRDDAVMVGDSSKDLGAASNAGVDSLLVFPDNHKLYYSLDELMEFQPTYVCGSLSHAQHLLLDVS